MTLLLNTISICVVIFSFFKIKWGILLYFLMLFFVPSLSYITIPVLQKWVSFNAIIFLALCVYSYKNKEPLYIAPIKPFILLFIFYLVLIPFQKEVPLDYQLSSWVGQSFRALILPLALLTIYKGGKPVEHISWILCFVIIAACVYGIFLINLKGFNPYLVAMMPNASDLEEYSMGGSGRIFGRICSFFPHPMTFGVFLVCSFNYSLFKILNSTSKLNLYFFWGMLVLIVINAISCGVRAVIAGIVVSALSFLLVNKKIKYFIWSIALLSVVYFFISDNEDLQYYITSIFESSKKSRVQGSSISMRLEQLQGCFVEIAKTPFVGHGYNWTAFYGTTKGDHPVILAFESLVFVVLCNWGVAGCVAWVLLLKRIWMDLWKRMKCDVDKYGVQLCLMLSYLSYTFITGDYCYIMYWIIFYCIIYLEQNSAYKKV